MNVTCQACGASLDVRSELEGLRLWLLHAEQCKPLARSAV